MAGDNRSGSLVVVVAVIGLVSTLGASALGGYWASRSVERELEAQRTAELEDTRRAVYIAFVRATTEACDAQTRVAQGNGNEDKVQSTALEVINQGALVHLLAERELRNISSQVTNAVAIDPTACVSNESFFAQMNPFVDAAQRELERLAE